MIQAHKKASSNQLNEIKSLPSLVTNSKQFIIISTNNCQNKIINQAIIELVNTNKNQGYVIINVNENKIQYFVGINKQLANEKKILANDVVKKINEISNGSGGGKDTFAQGGTVQLDSLDKIRNLLTQKF
jgi:alanyl-tRNA synthetase